MLGFVWGSCWVRYAPRRFTSVPHSLVNAVCTMPMRRGTGPICEKFYSSLLGKQLVVSN